MPLFIAHRGASSEAPENTLPAFRRALELGVDGIELDVQVTRDGVPVVFHDSTLNRLTSRRGRIAELSYKTLQTARVRGEPIPTLAEVLALIGQQVVVQIEIKSGVPVVPVAQTIRDARAESRVVFASFDPTIVNEARWMAPLVPRMLIRTERPRALKAPRVRALALIPILAALGVSGVSMDYRAIGSATFVSILKKRGLSVWCWTVNQPGTMRRLARWGVDAILSDRPALFASTFSPN